MTLVMVGINMVTDTACPANLPCHASITKPPTMSDATGVFKTVTATVHVSCSPSPSAHKTAAWFMFSSAGAWWPAAGKDASKESNKIPDAEGIDLNLSAPCKSVKAPSKGKWYVAYSVAWTDSAGRGTAKVDGDVTELGCRGTL